MERDTLILVIDSNLRDNRETESILSAGNYSVLLATSVNGSREILSRQNSIGLVLLEITIDAEGDGLVFADEYLKPNGIPFIFYTSVTKEEIIVKGETLSPYGCVVKSDQGTNLLFAVRSVLRLSQSEQREKMLIETLPCLTLIIDKDGYLKSVYFPDDIALGIKAEDLTGNSIADFFDQAETKTFLEIIRDCSETGDIKNLNFNLEISDRIHHYKSQVTRYSKDSVLVLCNDVTETMITEEDLQLKSLLLEQIKDGITITDLNGKIRYVNQAEVDLLGFTREDLIGKSTTAYGEDAEQGVTQSEIVSKTLADGSWSGQVINFDKNGNRRHLYCRTQIINNLFGDAVGLCGISSDITEQQQMLKSHTLSEAKYRQIIDKAGQMLFLHDLDGNFVDVNQKTIDITGYSREELLQMTVFDIDPLVEGRQYKVKYWQGMEFNQDGVIETLHRRKDGTIYSAEVSFRKIELGGDAYLLVFAQDITDRNIIEKTNQDNLRKVHILTKISRSYFWSVDSVGRYTGLSESVTEVLGYLPQEIIGKQTWDLHPKELRDAYMSETISRIKGDSDFTDFENPIVTKNGNLIWVSSAVFTERDEQNEIVGYHGIDIDITSSKNTKEELKRINSFLQSLVKYANAPIIVWDKKFQITLANPAFEKITGIDSDELSNLSFESLFPADRLEKSKAFFRRTIAGERFELVEIPIKNREGEKRILRWNSAPIFNADGSEIISAIAQGQDITKLKRIESEQKHLQEQLIQSQKLESIGRLAGGIAHDFNNILSIIIGHSESAIKDMNESEPAYHNLNEILKASERSALLTKQLLTFARKQKVEKTKINPNKTIEDMASLMRKLVGENISIDLVQEPEIWLLDFDPVQFDQVIANLTVNARDAINGEGRVTIVTKNVTVDSKLKDCDDVLVCGDYVLIEVSDNGCGIDEEVLTKIFEPFFTTKRLGEGTGLGLSTVFGIVKQNDGHITVKSALGEGTTFSMYIPKSLDCNEEQKPTKPLHQEQKLEGQETILIVEDEREILEILESLISSYGYKVLITNRPSNAVELFEKKGAEISLLITDVMMPEMNGFELAEEVTRIKPNLKVLFMSGYSDHVLSRDRNKKCKINFINKPFTHKALLLKIKEILQEED